MKIIIISLILCSLPFFSHADASGFSIGVGLASTSTDDCSRCDSSGLGLEVGMDFGRIFGIDAKLIGTDYNDNSGSFNGSYMGVNVGHTFNTNWLRVYGKAGAYKGKRKHPRFSSYSETNAAFGFGGRITPWGDQTGVYFKLEAMKTSFLDRDIGVATLTVGCKL